MAEENDAKNLLPKWKPEDLNFHFYERRMREDRECMLSMIEIGEGLTLVPEHYRQRSEETFESPALLARYQIEKSKGSGKFGQFKEPRRQFTDRELMTSITSDDRKTFITCYHEHFGWDPCQGKPRNEAESGRQLQKARRKLRVKEKYKKIKNLKFLNS